MNDLDTLRPEVREAFSRIDRGLAPYDDWSVVSAELLRLASYDCGLHEALCEHDELCEQFTAMRLRAERAEAELAALKARIAGSPVEVRPIPPTPAGLVGTRFAIVRLEE